MASRRTETIAALLSAAPPIAEEKPRQSRETAGSNNGQSPASQPHGTPDVDLDDTDLEAFTMAADAPLVRPRRRRAVDYQTVRINRPTAKVLRANWLVARQQDPLLSYTEFATIVTQRGLQTLAEERRSPY